MKILFRKATWQSVYAITQERLSMQFGRSRTGVLLPILKPIMYALLYAFALKRITKVEMSNYGAFVSSGIMIWNFICSCIVSANQITGFHISIMRSKPIHKSYFTFAFILERLILDGMAIVIMTLYLFVICKIPITIITPLALVYFAAVLAFCTMVASSIAYINCYNQDIGLIVSSGIPLCLWITPILYPIEILTDTTRFLVSYNPFYILINPIVEILYYNRLPGLEANIKLFGLMLLTYIIAYYIYKKLSRNLIYYIS